MITNENDLKISEMLNLSYKLWDKNSNTWSPMKPEYAKSFILYMIEKICVFKGNDKLEHGVFRKRKFEKLM